MPDANPASNEIDAPLRLLLVEDDPLDAALFHEMCGTLQDRYSITVSLHLADALEQVTAGPFDVVFLDLRLPDAAGVIPLQRILEIAPTLPIVVLSGVTDEDTVELCMEAGAVDYITKDELSPRVLRWAIGWSIGVKRDRRLTEANQLLAGYRAMLARGPYRASDEIRPLKESQPRVSQTLMGEYRQCLDAAMAAMASGKPQGDRIRSLALILGRYHAGARDALDIHLQAMEGLERSLAPGRRQMIAVEGRVLAIELLGHLAEYYRARVEPPEWACSGQRGPGDPSIRQRRDQG